MLLRGGKSFRHAYSGKIASKCKSFDLITSLMSRNDKGLTFCVIARLGISAELKVPTEAIYPMNAKRKSIYRFI